MSQQVNLYESRLRPSFELASARNLALVVLILLIILLPTVVFLERMATQKQSALNTLQTQLTEKQAELAQLSQEALQRKVSRGLAAEVRDAQTLLTMRKDLIAYLEAGSLGNSVGFSEALSGFSRLASNDLWLTGFSVTDGGAEIEIRGRVLNQEKLPMYVEKLRTEEAFRGKRFSLLQMRGVDPQEKKGQATAQIASQTPQMPPFVEFVLRSEDAAKTLPALSSGDKN